LLSINREKFCTYPAKTIFGVRKYGSIRPTDSLNRLAAAAPGMAAHERAEGVGEDIGD
jgi:hypothetical protein